MGDGIPSREERMQIYDLQALAAQIVIGNNRLVGLSAERAKWICSQFGFEGVDVELPEDSPWTVGSSCHIPHIMLQTHKGIVIKATHTWSELSKGKLGE